MFIIYSRTYSTNEVPALRGSVATKTAENRERTGLERHAPGQLFEIPVEAL